MKLKHLVLAFFATVSVAQAADGGLSFGAFGGIHAGTINNFSADTGIANKEGLMGIAYGWQAGLDVAAGPIWIKPFFQSSNTIADDYISSPRVEYRYTNTQAYFPVMYSVKKDKMRVGIGAFYAMPLSDEAIHDSGLAIALNLDATPKLTAGLHVMGGLRDNAQGGAAYNVGLNIGFKFN